MDYCEQAIYSLDEKKQKPVSIIFQRKEMVCILCESLIYKGQLSGLYYVLAVRISLVNILLKEWAGPHNSHCKMKSNIEFYKIKIRLQARNEA